MARRPSFWLSPAGIVLGYLLALVAATAGVVIFPFSIISLGLLFVVVGAFFVVAIPVIVFAYLFMAIGFTRATIGLSRRLLVGSTQSPGSCSKVEPKSSAKSFLGEVASSGLWDRWMDGV
jgi:hypothetical protein